MESSLFLDIGVLFIAASIIALVLRYFNQPLIPGYILAGILVGPVFGWVTDVQVISILSEIGVAFLLFIVGLELDVRKLRDVGAVVSIGAVVQIALLFFVGFLLSLALGFSTLVSVYLGVILSFSSTMVVIKLLSDKHELDTLHGRIVIGILLVQDVAAIVALSVLRGVDGFVFSTFGLSLAEGFGFILLAFLLGKYVFPRLFKFAARQQELLFLIALGVCFVFSALFYLVDFSVAIGAFVAGVTIGSLPYNTEIVSRVKSLRDFFVVLFFTVIGAELVFVDFSLIALPIVVFTLFTLIFLPFLTAIIAIFFGYKSKTGFLSGLALAQVSEFGLIIASAGKAAGVLGEEVFSMIIIVALITMAATAYFIKYDSWFYKHLGPFFKRFERWGKVSRELSLVRQDKAHEYVLIGLDRIGYSIFRKLRHLRKDVVVVDYNPDIIKSLLQKHIPCVYGDVSDVEIVQMLRLDQIKMLISTIPDHADNLYLIKYLKTQNKDTAVIVTSYGFADALELYEAGADYVIVPHYLGGEHVSVLLEDVSTDLDKLISTKLTHIRDLRHRQGVHPHHR